MGNQCDFYWKLIEIHQQPWKFIMGICNGGFFMGEPPKKKLVVINHQYVGVNPLISGAMNHQHMGNPRLMESTVW